MEGDLHCLWVLNPANSFLVAKKFFIFLLLLFFVVLYWYISWPVLISVPVVVVHVFRFRFMMSPYFLICGSNRWLFCYGSMYFFFLHPVTIYTNTSWAHYTQNQFGTGVKQLLVQKSSTRWRSVCYLLSLISYLLSHISYLLSLISYLLFYLLSYFILGWHWCTKK